MNIWDVADMFSGIWNRHIGLPAPSLSFFSLFIMLSLFPIIYYLHKRYAVKDRTERVSKPTSMPMYVQFLLALLLALPIAYIALSPFLYIPGAPLFIWVSFLMYRRLKNRAPYFGAMFLITSIVLSVIMGISYASIGWLRI